MWQGILRLALAPAAALALCGTALAGSPSPADGGTSAARVPSVPLFTSSLFALGTSLSDVGSAGPLAAGPSAAAADSDGDNLLTVDDGSDCPNAEYATIQSAVNAADPGDKIKVCRRTSPALLLALHPHGREGGRRRLAAAGAQPHHRDPLVEPVAPRCQNGIAVRAGSRADNTARWRSTTT